MVAPNTLQQCKTMMVLRTACLLFNAIFLVQILREDLFSILKGDAITMERWDPTVIIAAPFPLDNLQLVVSKACRSIMIPTELILTIILLYYRGSIDINLRNMMQRDSIRRIFRYTFSYLFMMAILNALVFFLAIMCGASPSENLIHTVLSTVYFTTLAFGYIQPSSDVSLGTTVERVVLSPDYSELSFKESMVNEMNMCILYATFFVTIPFMILNILDHGEQNQRWPVPVVLGALCGHLVGVGAGTLLGVYRLYRLGSGKLPFSASNKARASPPTDRKNYFGKA